MAVRNEDVFFDDGCSHDRIREHIEVPLNTP
jgi:hypothetical protein